jgi:hypothetical protein
MKYAAFVYAYAIASFISPLPSRGDNNIQDSSGVRIILPKTLDKYETEEQSIAKGQDIYKQKTGYVRGAYLADAFTFNYKNRNIVFSASTPLQEMNYSNAHDSKKMYCAENAPDGKTDVGTNWLVGAPTQFQMGQNDFRLCFLDLNDDGLFEGILPIQSRDNRIYEIAGLKYQISEYVPSPAKDKVLTQPPLWRSNL